MKELAPGLWQLRGFPPNAINVYLAGDLLIDAATKLARRRILKQLEGRTLSAHALTHVHPDHQGCTKLVCEKFGVPLLVGERDVPPMEEGNIARSMASPRMARVSERMFAGPPRKVDRVLREGDTVGEFAVLDVPGHSPGHVAYWREADRVLILGDVLFGLNPVTGRPGYHWPPDALTSDPARNKQSARKLAGLAPSLICFGHGPPRRDTEKFVEFVEQNS